MSTSESKKYFDHKTGYGISKGRLKAITQLAGDLKQKTVLDIGCGNGELGATLIKQGAQAVDGCDIAQGAIEQAAKKLHKAFTFDVASDSLLQLSGGKKYDVVIATELIEHLFSPHKLLTNVAEVIDTTGTFIVTTPNFLVFSNRIKMLLGKFVYTKTGLLDESHVHFFTYPTLKNMLTENGFEVVQENNIYHPKVPRFIAKLFPGLFVFQMVFACKLAK